MNHTYKLVWNTARRAWMVVCELTRTGRKSSTSSARKARRAAAIASVTLSAMSAWADPAPNALPSGAQIAAGQAAISQNGAQLKIQQSSAKAIINWQSFDIGRSAEVQFTQPDASAVTLNRVNSATASQIYGKLTANGQIFLLNQNGIIFGQSAKVDVGGIVAGAMKITDKDFLDGNYHFTDGKGVVTNSGTISASDGSMIALLAPEVRNEGVIRARLGTIMMAAGEAITLTNSRSGIAVVIDKGAMKALVENRQLVWAEDGRVFMSAMAASALQAAVINNSGTIEAQSAVRRGNSVHLTADSIDNSGSISVAGRTPEAQGGTIALAGNDIAVKDTAVLDASGPAGGGAILVGGGWQGSGDMRQATRVRIDHGAILDASAKTKGDGGTIVAWSDVHNNDSKTTVLGTLRASGGTLGGNGGQIETSGHQVETDTIQVDASAARGLGGLWLIDPYDYTINATAAGNIVTALNAGTSVTVSTQTSNASYGGGASSNGDITVSSAISKTSGGAATLTLQADRNIIVNAAIGSTSGTLGIVLSADNAGSASLGGVNVGANLTSNGGTILIGGAAGTASHGIAYARNLTASTPAVQIGTNVAISSGGGSITINGKTTATTGSYSAAGGGVYVLSGASINTGGGNLYISGISTGDAKEFGFGVEGNSNTLTTFTTSVGSGNIFIDAQNTLNANGALGLVNSGNQARIQFSAPSVAAILVSINGSPQASSFTMVPPCGTAYPNCGTMLVPGSNNSYLYASYQAVNMATHALYVTTSTGSKTYDGTTAISGLTYTTTGAPGDYSTSGLSFTTPSKNAATYYTLVDGASNPTTFHSASTGYDYAIAYFYSNYTINPKTITISATNKVYDGTTAAALTSSGAIAGDSLTFSATGGFSDANYGLAKTVNVTGITLSGTDAANYSLSGSTLTTTADITKRPVNLTANRTYDTTTAIAASTITLGNLVTGETLTLTGNGSVADKTAANGKTLSLGTFALGNGTGGLASNYTLTGGTDIANITPVILSVSGLSAQNKTYDGTTAAILSGSATLSGVLGSDNVTVSGTSGTFADKNVGNGKTVTFAGLTIGGTDAANYTLSGSSGTATANITPASLSITTSNVTKTYDGGLSALGSATVASGTLFGSDTLSGGSFAFTNKNAGTGNKTVTVAGVTVSDGNSGSNYTVSYVSNTTSTINTATISAITGITASDKTYDATRTATLDTSGASFTGRIGSDVLTVTGASGLFADKNYGTGKTVTISGLTLGGTDAGNYTLASSTATTTASIAKALLSISGITASNKTYDGTTTDSLNNANASVTPLGSDAVSLVTTGASGTFASKNIGTAKTVTASGYTLTGTDAGNYTLVQPTGLSADITPALLSITTSNVTKTYDGGISATGTATVASGTLFSGDTLSGGTFAFTDKNAGTGNKTVTVAGVTVSDSNSGANYTVSYVANTTSTINKATISAITGITASDKTYDAARTATLDTSGASFTGRIGSDVLTVIGASGLFADKNYGTGKTVSISGLTLGGTDSGNYTLASSTATTTASITKASLSISGITAANKTYDGTTTASFNAASASVTPLGSDVISLVITGASGSFADKNAGNGKTVTASGFTITGTDAGNYTLVQPTGLSANITAASLSITTSNVTKTYDGGLSALGSATVASGTLFGSDTLSGGTFAFTNKNAGTGNKTVTVSGVTVSDGNSGGNYTVSYVSNTTSTINTATISAITGITASDKTYDAARTATIDTSGASFTGKIGSDVLTVAGASGLFADKNYGTGKTVAISGLTLGGTDAGNYTLASSTATTTASIAKASLSITGLIASNKTYDGTTAASFDTTGTSITPLGSDVVSLVTTGASGSFANRNAGTGKAVTASGFTITGTDAANYTLVQPTGLSADITPALLSITTSNVTKTYDGGLSAAGTAMLASGTLFGSDTLSGGTFAFTNKNAGTGNKTVTVAGVTVSDGNSGANYTVSYVASTTSTISKATISAITGITASDKTYDGTTIATLDVSGAGFTGKIGSDILTVTTSTGAFADKNAGNSKSVTITGLTLGGADAGNYTLASTTGSTTANVSKATISSISGITASNKTYDGSTSATLDSTGATFSGKIGSDVLTVSTASGTFSTKDAGTGRTVNITGLTLGGTDAGNYTLANPSAATTADIEKAELSVSGLTVQSKTYDGTDTALFNGTPTLLGIIGADSVSFSGTVAAHFVDKNAGTGKAVTITGLSLGGSDAGNYTLANTTASTTANIAAVALVVTTGAVSKVYDGTVSASGAAATTGGTSLFGTDTMTGGTVAFTDRNAGTGKTVTVTGVTINDGNNGSNYTVTYVNNTNSVITKATITAITGVTAANKTYDGTTAASLNTADAAFSGKISGDTLTLVSATGAFADKNAGNGKAVFVTGLSLGGADAGNYTLADTTGSATADITRATITNIIGITASNKTYDGSTNANLNITGAAFSGKIAGDTLTLASANGSFADKNAGNGKTVSITGLSLAGADAGNYTLIDTTASTTANIARAIISAVSGITAANKTYDGSTSANLNTTNAVFSGKISGDTLMLASANGSFADKNAGNGKAVSISDLSLGGADAGNYTLTATTGSATADITRATITNITGITASNKTYDGTTAAVLNTANTGYSGKISGDTLTLASATGAFADKNAGNGKAVSISGLSLGGADAGNYTLAATTASASADITRAIIGAVSGITAVNKTYDGSTSANLNTTNAVFSGKISGDTLMLASANGSFADKNAGNGKAVYISGLSLGGADAGNYTLAATTASASADITRATITNITGITASNKTYDGTTTASLNTINAAFSGLIAGDSLTLASASGAFASKNAGTGKPVTIADIVLSGSDAANYSLGFTTLTTTGAILPRAVNVSGATVSDKTFDGSNTATITGASLNGLISGDQVTLANATTGVYSGTGPGNAIAVTTTMTLSGNDAANYTLLQPSGLTGTINAVLSEPREPATTTPAATPPTTTIALIVPAEATSPIIAGVQPAAATSAPQQIALVPSGTTTVALNTGGTAAAAGVTQGFTSVRDFAPVTVASGSAFSFVLPSDTFTHSDSKANIAMTATTAAGGALPEWLTFSQSDRRFTGTAPQGVSQLKVTVKARDQIGNEVTATLTLSFGKSQQI